MVDWLEMERGFFCLDLYVNNMYKKGKGQIAQKQEGVPLSKRPGAEDPGPGGRGGSL